MKKINICQKCKIFTLTEKCPKCKGEVTTTVPPKYSVDDKYASYRREAKEKERKEQGML
jgi:H/ACA ribonucleoprotein complex subunit 3